MEYKLQDMMAPVWSGRRVWRETFTMIREDGCCKAPFLFRPDKVEKIESYDGKKQYELGRDCVIDGDWLVLTENSRIPAADWKRFYYDTKEEAEKGQPQGVNFGPIATTDGRYINLHALANPEYITDWQIAVTYTTKESYMGYKPQSALGKLPRFQKKLEQKEPIKIVVYGDSICCGWDCSGMYGLEPGQPIFPELLRESLETFYGIPVELVNTSVGGVNSDWALENAEERAIAYQPDLFILGFGMNDRCPGDEYRKKTQALLERLKEGCPQAEYVLIATSLPNPLAETPPQFFWCRQHEYGDALRDLCGTGVVLADVQAVNRELLRKKRYEDIGANMINHPNDFFARIYAHVLDALLKP